MDTRSELHYISENLLPVIRKNRVKFILFYLFFLGYFSIPGLQIPTLEIFPTYFSSLMDQRTIEHALLYFPEKSWTSIDNVNPVLLRCIVAMEDGAFFEHKGVDWKELRASIKTNKRKKRTARGGSTITMQLSKNLYYTTNKSVLRKGKEIITAFRMEKEISKKAILAQYVNIIEWGDGIFGISAAAKEYFRKEPGKLTLSECSKLAAVIPSPLVHRPDINSRYVQRRSAIIRARYSDIILPW